MNQLVEELTKNYNEGNLSVAEEKCLLYAEECKQSFLEELSVNTGTDFAGAVIFYAQICSDLKKPWKAIPLLTHMNGCIRFLEDYMQNREVLTATCFSVASAFERAGFLPEAIHFYRKSLKLGEAADVTDEAASALLYLLLYFEEKLEKEDRKLLIKKLGEDRFPSFYQDVSSMVSRAVKFDPIERSELFIAIRYDLEERVDQLLSEDRSSDPFCVRYWNLKKKVLKDDYNIDWNTPAECNPEIRFC